MRFHAQDQPGRMGSCVTSPLPTGMRIETCGYIRRNAGVDAAVDTFNQIEIPGFQVKMESIS